MCLKYLIFQFSHKLRLSIYYFICISNVLNFFHMDDAYILFKSSLTIRYFILMVTFKFSFHKSAAYICLGWSLSRGTWGRVSGRWKLTWSPHINCIPWCEAVCAKRKSSFVYFTHRYLLDPVCVCICVCVREILIIIYIPNILIYIFLFLIIPFNKYIFYYFFHCPLRWKY